VRLGLPDTRCTILEAGPMPLGPFDEEMVGLLSDASAKENIDIHCDVSVTGIQRRGRGFAVSTKDGRQFNVDLVVHGAGRAPDIDSLDLERAGIDCSSSGITVDVHMRTTNVAIYWLARMLEAGEDALYVARRMVRFASEDVGNADPFALCIALGAMESFRFLGHPEGDLALAQAAVYLATAPKSNSVYKAWNAARKLVREKGALPVPLHIRNAPTGLMKDLGYGKDYRYAHDYKDGFAIQEYLPDAIVGNLFYFPTDRGYEKMIVGRLKQWRALKEKNKK